MSFIHCYQYLKNLERQSLSHLDLETIVRYEKLLKTEVRIDSSKFNTNDVERFLEALRNNSVLLQFLQANEEFYALLFERFNFLKDYGVPSFDDYDYIKLKQAIAANLMQELNQFVINRFEQHDFLSLKVLLKYQELLPQEVLDLLTHRIEFKLDSYITQLVQKGKFTVEGEFKKVSELIVLNPVEVLVKKEAKVSQLMAQEMVDIINHIDKPGIFLFFETMFKGFHYLFYVPTDPYELKIRNRVMSDFKFMLGLQGIVLLILVLGFFFFKKDEPVKQSNSKSKGFYQSFINPAQNEVLLMGNFSDTLKTGFDFVGLSYVVPKSKETVTIANKTDYDLVVFSDFEVIKAYSEVYKNTTNKGFFCYIKRNDSLTIDRTIYPVHFYFGQSLFSTKALKQRPSNLPRFFHAHQNTANLITQPFELKCTKVTFEGDKNGITLQSDKGVFVDGVLITNMLL